PMLSQSPTLLTGSMAGMIIGTAAYMSPEQARGKPVDKRTDIWAFGCVLYEMLTNRVPFAGETFTDTIAAILGGEPNWQALPQTTPANIRLLLRRCLEKDSRQRLRDIGDSRIEIQSVVARGPGVSTTTSSVADRRVSLARLSWLVITVLLVALVGAAIVRNL